MEPINTTPTPTAVDVSLRRIYFTEKQLARQLPKGSVRKLRTWRNLRTGPPWLKIGREVVYLRDAVKKWMDETQLLISRESQKPAPRRRGGAR